MNRGAKVLVIQTEQDWLKVSDLTNVEREEAWINEKDLSVSPTEPLSWEEFRKEEYLSNHKDIDEQFYTAIKSSAIVPGMDREMVKASLGPPDKSIQNIEQNNSISEIWIYHKEFIRVNLINDRVTTYTKYK